MSEVWCVTEISADEENPRIQHISMTAYVDALEAEMAVGVTGLKDLEEDRNGIVVGRLRASRYCFPDLLTVETANENADHEIQVIANVIRRYNQVENNPCNSLGLIVTRSLNVAHAFRGQTISKRMLQELRRLHCGMPFHYGHSSVPQEGASLCNDFIARSEKLKNIYYAADIGLQIPDEKSFPEIMVAHWNGSVRDTAMCTIQWKTVISKIHAENYKAA